MPEALFNAVAGLRPATFLKKRLWHKCFPLNFAKISINTYSYRTPLVAASAFFSMYEPVFFHLSQL